MGAAVTQLGNLSEWGPWIPGCRGQVGALTARGEVGVMTGTDGRAEAEVRIVRLVLTRGLGWLTLVFLDVN